MKQSFSQQRHWMRFPWIPSAEIQGKDPALHLNTAPSNSEETHTQRCTSAIIPSTQYLDNEISVVTASGTSPWITGIALQQAGGSQGSPLCCRYPHASQTCQAPPLHQNLQLTLFPLCRKPRGFPKSHDKSGHFHSKKGITFLSPWEISAVFQFTVISGRK